MDFKINKHYFRKLNVSLLIGIFLISIVLKVIHPSEEWKSLILPFLVYIVGANLIFSVVLNLVIYYSRKGKMSNQTQVIILKWLLILLFAFPIFYSVLNLFSGSME
jgi:hypothetical protein